MVTNTANAGAGSLRQALADSQHGDTIRFDLPTSDPGYDATSQSWTITVTERWDPPNAPNLSAGRTLSLLVVEKNIDILGPGANKVTIRGLAAPFGSGRLRATARSTSAPELWSRSRSDFYQAGPRTPRRVPRWWAAARS